ncbi:acetyl-CoA carboxylase biotin carboxyl carrier protein subunit [Alphaproteobacteria bacterium]|jgi:biotin carboxyl carrier protein|nr:acetyl-CoA carboxylase biotin carboxyl carrier protein subunit [Alphaproteobacteria bacterium]
MSTEVLTSVPGNIWKVLVNVGDEVREGDVLFIMEVMKSEVNHNAPINGIVTEVNIQNDQEGVSPGTIAIVID